MGTAQTFAGMSRLDRAGHVDRDVQHIGQSSPFFFAAAMLCVGSLMAGQLAVGRPAARGEEGAVLN